MLFNKKIETITLEDINSLIENCVCENKFLDYKRELHIDLDKEKKEFLADISSFANSTGGDLIFGIEEDSKEKIPTKITGISYENDDKLIRRLEDLIRQSIQPVILNIEFRVIDISDNKCILIIRIPQSILSPHRIEFKGCNKFFTRNNKGKYEMDVDELRLAFNLGIDLNKRIENYKMDRYYNLISNRYNLLENDMPIFVIHYIPISAFSSNLKILSLKEIKNAMQEVNATALGDGYLKSINVDGVSIKCNEYGESSWAYYKNNGIIEKATTNFFEKDYVYPNVMPKVVLDFINGYQVLNKTIEDFNNMKAYYKKIGINPPIIVSCAFLNAVNYTIPNRGINRVLGQIDREILCIADLFIEDINKETEVILKPIFDSIWNACGYEKCLAYDEHGEYTGLKLY